MEYDERYPADVLASGWRDPRLPPAPVRTVVEKGIVVEDVGSGFVGEVMRIERDCIELEDRHRARRLFPLGGGYLIDGAPVILELGVATNHAPVPAARTASGSRAAAPQRARVARESRIYVEGRHDAELVEKIWGDDLRAEGVVVEYMGGVDDLAAIVTEFGPGPGRRLGVLVDHLVEGTKESRIVADAVSGPVAEHVLIVGHPFIDIWQAVKPARLGVHSWPTIPRGVDWKHGICAAFGWPHETQADIARAWQHILTRVESYTDLEPAMLGRMEQLIDFVTSPAH